MVTTSPDNIWTPDAGDDYALTTDLAATADTIQDALNGFTGRKGTTTQMNAFAATNGDTWQNTTNGQPYRRIGGVWVSQDTGWISVTSFQNSFSASTDSPVAYRRIGGVTYLRGDLKRAAAPGGLVAFTLPAGYRPGTVVRLAGRQDLGVGLTVDVTGGVIIAASNSSTPGSGSGYALNGFSWVADS